MLNKILPIVLAGGKSSRMGRDKRFVSFNDTCFLDNTINILYKVGFSNVLVSGLCINYNSVIDEFLSIGPSSAFYKFLSSGDYVYYDHLLFIPIDMPFLHECFIFNMFLNIKKNTTVYYDNFNFPLLLSKDFLSRKIFSEVVFFNESSNKSVKIFLDNILVSRISYDDAFVFANINNVFDLYFFGII
ncbi:MAG TPA: NTP transferase domain-containing protein [Candidatus Azoamicus sp. OHIO1]